MSVSDPASEPKGPWGKEKDVQNQAELRNEKRRWGKWGWGDLSPGRITKPGPGFCIILILPMKPFQGSERGSDFPKVTQLEASCLQVSFA